MLLSRTIAAFCIIDDALQALGHTDHPQAKTPASAILTLALLAALEFGGKHNKALAFAKDLGLFTHVPSPSRFNRRLHALYPLLLPLRKIAPSGLTHLLAQVWKNLYQAQAYALDTFPLPACENIRAPRSRLFPDRAYRGFIPSKRVYFHGLKLHLLVDDGKFVHEVNLTPGSFHDLASLLLLPLDLPEGAELYLDRGYESHLYEDLLREAQEVVCTAALNLDHLTGQFSQGSHPLSTGSPKRPRASCNPRPSEDAYGCTPGRQTAPPRPAPPPGSCTPARPPTPL